MFWEQNQYLTSDIDLLLNQPNCTIELLLLQPTFLQEVKVNNKLQAFLCNKENLKIIINHSYTLPTKDIIYEANEEELNKTTFIKLNTTLTQELATELCHEILLLDAWSISQSILSSFELMELLFIEPLTRVEDLKLDSSLSGRIGKVTTHFITSNYPSLPSFFQLKWDTIFPLLCNNFEEPAMAELALRIWCSIEPPCEEEKEGNESFNAEKFAEILTDNLKPEGNEQVHNNTQQFLLDIITYSMPSQLQPMHPTTKLVLEMLNEINIDKLLSYLKLRDGISLKSSIHCTLCILKELLLWNPSNFGGNLSQCHRNLVLKIGSNMRELIELTKYEMFLPKEITNTTGTFIPLGKIRLQIGEICLQLMKALFYYQNLASSLLPSNRQFKGNNQNELYENKSIFDKEDSDIDEDNIDNNGLNSLLEALSINSDDQSITNINNNNKTHKKKLSLSLNNSLLKEKTMEENKEVINNNNNNNNNNNETDNNNQQQQQQKLLTFNPLQLELITYHYELNTIIINHFINENIIDWLINLFFEYKWNNFYHSIFVELIHLIFNWELLELTPNNLLIPQLSQGVKLIEYLLKECHLIKKIINLHENNIKREKNIPSIGNLGYILQLGNTIQQFLINNQQLNFDEIENIKQLILNQGWNNYYNTILSPIEIKLNNNNNNNNNSMFNNNKLIQLINQNNYHYAMNDYDEDEDDENENENQNVLNLNNINNEDEDNENNEDNEDDEDYIINQHTNLDYSSEYIDIDRSSFDDEDLSKQYYDERESESDEDDLAWLNNHNEYKNEIIGGGLMRSFASDDINLLSDKIFQELINKEEKNEFRTIENDIIQFELDLEPNESEVTLNEELNYNQNLKFDELEFNNEIINGQLETQDLLVIEKAGTNENEK